jgi:hypothetical protein
METLLQESIETPDRWNGGATCLGKGPIPSIHVTDRAEEW